MFPIIALRMVIFQAMFDYLTEGTIFSPFCRPLVGPTPVEGPERRRSVDALNATTIWKNMNSWCVKDR